MKQRCTNPKTKDFHCWGGKGITFDPAWSEFTAFLTDMGECPPGHSLDRIDNNLNYTKDNCRWVWKENQGANRAVMKTLVIDGKTIAAVHIARTNGIPGKTYLQRLRYGWSVEEAATHPVLRRVNPSKSLPP